MDTLTIVSAFFTTIVGCIALDWHMRGLREKKMRKALQAEVQSYLRKA